MGAIDTKVKIRTLKVVDLEEVVRIDTLHTGEATADYWQRVFEEYLGRAGRTKTIGIGIDDEDGLAAYLFGEVRAAEFGSSACGWVFAVGVDREHLRRRFASLLLADAVKRFRKLGMTKVRTMVARADVPVLSFFRSSGFIGGPYVQLEMDIESDPKEVSR